MGGDARLFAPSAARNRAPILAVLKPELPATGLVLEIASGSGEHAVHFAAACLALRFQPTDPTTAALASIDAWTKHEALANVLPALQLDAAATDWPVKAADVIVCINMIHIAPWAATHGLLAGAARVLPARGLLFLYGPYRRGGANTSQGNIDFDADLRSRDPAWGIRDLEAISELAAEGGFTSPRIVEMPANNLSLLFRRR
jgi:SAM-dependent methyltransferase